MSAYSEKCMKELMHKLHNPKPPGKWWKEEVRQKAARGEPVSLFAMQLANSGRQE